MLKVLRIPVCFSTLEVFYPDLHASDSFHSTHPDSIVLQCGWFLSAQKYYVVCLYTDCQHR